MYVVCKYCIYVQYVYVFHKKHDYICMHVCKVYMYEICMYMYVYEQLVINDA